MEDRCGREDGCDRALHDSRPAPVQPTPGSGHLTPNSAQTTPGSGTPVSLPGGIASEQPQGTGIDSLILDAPKITKPSRCLKKNLVKFQPSRDALSRILRPGAYARFREGCPGAVPSFLRRTERNLPAKGHPQLAYTLRPEERRLQ